MAEALEFDADDDSDHLDIEELKQVIAVLESTKRGAARADPLKQELAAKEEANRAAKLAPLRVSTGERKRKALDTRLQKDEDIEIGRAHV